MEKLTPSRRPGRQPGPEGPRTAPQPPRLELGLGLETVRRWVVDAQVDAGQRAGTTSAEHAEIKALPLVLIGTTGGPCPGVGERAPFGMSDRSPAQVPAS
jgi:hypothetical protein